MENLDPRVEYAAERTMLAWIRTGLAMMGFGFVVARFNLFLREFALDKNVDAVSTPGLSLWIGIFLVSMGAAISFYAGVHHTKRIRRLKAGQPMSDSAWNMGRIVSVLLAVIGAAMAAYLVFLRTL